MCQLHEAMGVDIGTTYRNDKRCQEFILSIAACIAAEMRAEFAKCHFFSFISDGATDSAHKEAEILFIKFAHLGTVNTKFVAIKNVGKADSATIEGAITESLTHYLGLDWKRKLDGSGTDGASVMLGVTSGVVQRISDRVGHDIVGIHCSAHRLELAYRDSCKKVPFYEKVSNLLLNLYLFYRNSPLNRHQLKEACKILKTEPRMPSRVAGTRWLPHTLRAIENVLKGYKAIVLHLRELETTSRTDKGAKAKHFVNMLKQKDTVYMLYFMWDVVTILSRVSLAFQNRAATIADIFLQLETAKDVLDSYKQQDGPKLASVEGSELFSELGGSLRSFPGCRTRIIELLLSNLTNRFRPDQMEILKAASLVNLSMWPSQIKSEPDFGDANIRFLSSEGVFGEYIKRAGGDPLQIPQEWTEFKSLVYNSFDNVPSLSWSRLTCFKNTCSGVFMLMDIILSLPASSAEAERGFFKMKTIKTDWRSCLSDIHLTDLMRIELESPPIEEFQPDDAVNLWLKTAKTARRPTFGAVPIRENLQDDKSVSVEAADNAVEADGANEDPVGQDAVGQDARPISDEGFVDNDTEFYSDDESLEDMQILEKRAYALFSEDLLSYDHA